MDDINDFLENEKNNLASSIQKFLDYKYRDTVKKEIGDRINVVDFSSVTHVNGDELEPEEYDTDDNIQTFMVIETNQKYQFRSCHKTYSQNLIIVNLKDKKQYRVNSSHVKLL
jgi:hypothetical protein